MDVRGYRHNYKGFYEKTIYHMPINRGGEQPLLKVPDNMHFIYEFT